MPVLDLVGRPDREARRVQKVQHDLAFDGAPERDAASVWATHWPLPRQTPSADDRAGAPTGSEPRTHRGGARCCARRLRLTIMMRRRCRMSPVQPPHAAHFFLDGDDGSAFSAGASPRHLSPVVLPPVRRSMDCACGSARGVESASVHQSAPAVAQSAPNRSGSRHDSLTAQDGGGAAGGA